MNKNNHQKPRWIAGAIDLCIILLLLLFPLLWLTKRITLLVQGHQIVDIHWSWKIISVFVLLIAFRIILAVVLKRKGGSGAGLWRVKPYPQLMTSIFFFYLFFGGAELVLTWKGFSANLPPVIFEGKDEHGGRVIPHTLPDPELLWKFQPGSEFAGRTINQLGFRDREVNPQKAPGTRRIICMGDSVTGQGLPGYSQYLHDKLQTNPPVPGSWEAFNIGVHGYCVLQGLVLFERLDPVLDPDYVTIYFGWNDHWLDSSPMSQQMAVRMGSVSGHIYDLLKQSRLFSYLIVKLNPYKPTHQNNSARVYRVPPQQYRDGLTSLVKKIRASGAVPILITAPRRNLTKELMDKTYAVSIADAEKVHDEYVEITREVSRQENAPLFDLAEVLKGEENNSLFARDGIHFDHYSREGYIKEFPVPQPGLERVGRELYLFISNLVVQADGR